MRCRLCGWTKRLKGRGLCSACRQRIDVHGIADLADFPRANVPRSEVLDEWRMQADRRLSQAENVRRLAPRMGMSEHALEQAIRRLKNAGLLEWRSAA